MKKNVSTHVTIDRWERITYIVDNLGFGNVVITCPSSSNRNNIEELTDTGVIIVRSRKTNDVITAFIASIDKVIAIYRNNSQYSRIPNFMYKRVTANKTLLKNQPL